MKPSFVYAKIDLEKFVDGANPETQPGVLFNYHHYGTPQEPAPGEALCFFVMDVEPMLHKLSPSDNPDLFGVGTLQLQHIHSASIIWNSPEFGRQVFSKDDGSWNQARQEAGALLRGHLMEQGFEPDTPGDLELDEEEIDEP